MLLVGLTDFLKIIMVIRLACMYFKFFLGISDGTQLKSMGHKYMGIHRAKNFSHMLKKYIVGRDRFSVHKFLSLRRIAINLRVFSTINKM